MAEENDSERSEEATQTRREDFRKRGQVAHTKELGTCLLLFASCVCLLILGKFFIQNLFDLFGYSFGQNLVSSIRSGNITIAASLAGEKAVIMILPFMGISAIIGLASSILQIGFLQVEDALTPDFERLNPIQGFGRVFSFKGIVEVIKSVFKMIFIISLLYFLLSTEIKRIPYLSTYNLEQIIAYVGTSLVKLFSGMGFLMLAIAGADYFLQRWDLERKMMMTKQEIKEEHKQREGDPLIKARVRKIQREMSNRRMMDAIPKATVVITNPTHIAVVLKYDESLPAPQLVAKGADNIAEKIRAIAREHNIPIVENRPLARTIFKTLKIGQVIPRDLFVAVAEVLSYIYKLRKRVKK